MSPRYRITIEVEEEPVGVALERHESWAISSQNGRSVLSNGLAQYFKSRLIVVQKVDFDEIPATQRPPGEETSRPTAWERIDEPDED